MRSSVVALFVWSGAAVLLFALPFIAQTWTGVAIGLAAMALLLLKVYASSKRPPGQ